MWIWEHVKQYGSGREMTSAITPSEQRAVLSKFVHFLKFLARIYFGGFMRPSVAGVSTFPGVACVIFPSSTTATPFTKT